MEGRHIVLLVADAQSEVMQGAANDGVGAIIKQMERLYMAIPPHKHRQCTGEVIRQLQRRPAAVLCLVEVCLAALSVLENCSRKIVHFAVMSLYRAPPRPRGWRPRSLIWTALGGCGQAERGRS